MCDFERWKHFIGVNNLRGEPLTEEQLRRWVSDSNKMLECVFCQVVEPPSYFQLSDYNLRKHLDELRVRGVILDQIAITCCPLCREYKGIQPHIPGWSDFE